MADMNDVKTTDSDDDESLFELLRSLPTAIGEALAASNSGAAKAFNQLIAQAAEGSRSAADKINNPWCTSESPKNAMARTRRHRNHAWDEIRTHFAPLIAACTVISETNETIRAHERAQQRFISDDPGEHFLQLLSDNGVSDRTLKRASSDTVAFLAELLNDRGAPSFTVDADMEAKLKQYRLLDLVCATDNGDCVPTFNDSDCTWSEWGNARRRFGEQHCYLPKQVALDPVRRPRGHSRWVPKDMKKVMWDEVGSSNMFRVYVRAYDASEDWDADKPIPDLPPFETVDEMIANDEKFARIHQESRLDFQRLDALRTLREFDQQLLATEHDGTYCEVPGFHIVAYEDPEKWANSLQLHELEMMSDAEFEETDYTFFVTQQIINFTAAQIDVIQRDEDWAAWKEWGILLVTIDKYLGPLDEPRGPWQDNQNLVWLYLLKGRFCRNDISLPIRFRELLFDWLQMPFVVSEVPCTKYLVPERALSGELDADDVANLRRRALLSNKRM